jgi:hypothetical protein
MATAANAHFLVDPQSGYLSLEYQRGLSTGWETITSNHQVLQQNEMAIFGGLNKWGFRFQDHEMALIGIRKHKFSHRSMAAL